MVSHGLESPILGSRLCTPTTFSGIRPRRDNVGRVARTSYPPSRGEVGVDKMVVLLASER